MKRFIICILLLCFSGIASAAITNPIVRTQWGTWDLRTWRRQCNNRYCDMCNTIDCYQSQYFEYVNSQKTKPSVVAPKPPEVDVYAEGVVEPIHQQIMPEVLEALKLNSNSVLGDWGSGGCELLIAAVEKYGCTAIGIEYDKDQFIKGYTNVFVAELEGRIPKGSIELIPGDFFEKGPEVLPRITHMYCYQYNETLTKLKPMIEKVDRVVVPFHQVPGLSMYKYKSVYTWVKPTYEMRTYKVCRNGRCSYEQRRVQVSGQF